MPAIAGPNIPTSGLVLVLDGGNKRSYSGAGTVCNDLGNNKYIGTLTNSPTYSTNNQGYFTFNGSTSSQYIIYNTYFPQITVDLSIELWLNPATTQSYTYTDIVGNHNDPYLGFVIQQQTAVNNRFFLVYGNGTSWSNITGGPGYIDLTANTWQHVVFIKSGTNIYNYKNSVLYSSTTGASTIAPNTGTNFMIGNGVALSIANRSFNGSIASCRIYNRALSSDEIYQIYNCEKGRFGL